MLPAIQFQCSTPDFILVQVLFWPALVSVFNPFSEMGSVWILLPITAINIAMSPKPCAICEWHHPISYFGLHLQVEQVYLHYRASVPLEAQSTLSDHAFAMGQGRG